MALNISKLFALMQSTLRDNNLVRPTALKNLQIQEDGDPFKILIGTILSARTRDEVTTAVIKALFSRFKNPDELSRANLSDIKKLIQKIGFYNVKASRLKEVSQLIIKKYNGEVPSNLDDLLTLPGVGRKTANCVLVYGFKKAAIPVDIHVHRISNRIGLVNTKTPEKTEIELSSIIDRRYWLKLNNTFVMYGQNVCLPVTPNCKLCKLKKICKFYHSTN